MKLTKGLTVDECVAKAGEYISKHGMCLLLFDVQHSRDSADRGKLQEQLKTMMQDLNARFSDYFPENNLATPNRKEKGFQILLGDGSWAGINSADIIPDIVKYQKTSYPNIPLYWSIVKDGFDKEGTILVR